MVIVVGMSWFMMLIVMLVVLICLVIVLVVCVLVFGVDLWFVIYLGVGL